MAVVAFPVPKKTNNVPEIMVDFSVSGGSVSAAGRMPLAKAIEKLEELTDLLRIDLSVTDGA